MTPLERRVKIALGAGLTAPAIARLLRISIGKAQRIAAKMAIERMNTGSWPARGCSLAVLLSSVGGCGHYAIGRDKLGADDYSGWRWGLGSLSWRRFIYSSFGFKTFKSRSRSGLFLSPPPPQSLSR